MAAIDRIVVVGAGECGARAVSELRNRGFAGSVTLIGDETRTPYERPPLSKAALVADDEPAPVTVTDEHRLASLDVSFVCGDAVSRIDRDSAEVVLAGGERIAYDRLLLATGARPRVLALPGFEHVYVLRTFDDALALRAHLRPGVRLTVIGAGFIGLEVAASARQRGCEVTVLEVADRPLGRMVPEAIAEVIARRHAEAGVAVHCGVRIDAIRSVGDRMHVLLGERPPVECDVVVAGVGAVPNVELAESSGLAVDNGVAVDDRLRSSDPAIFAAGDCASVPHPLYSGRRIRLESWRNAHDQAVVAAANLLGHDEVHRAVPWFWSDQYDLGLQVAGLPDAAATGVVRSRLDGSTIHFGLADDGRLVSAAGVAFGTAIARDIRIAEMLIAAAHRPDLDALADASVGLKQLLKV